MKPFAKFLKISRDSIQRRFVPGFSFPTPLQACAFLGTQLITKLMMRIALSFKHSVCASAARKPWKNQARQMQPAHFMLH
jgi:formate/nitrite transporter FocA (FNT family)